MSVIGLKPADALAGIPSRLRDPLLLEFNKVLRNFRERRWEPAELNGGKFSEVVYCILQGYTSGTFPQKPSKPRNMVDACRNLERADPSRFPRSVRIQIPRMLVALYEIRNNRNVGHVGGDVDPNNMDASVVVAMAKWIMAELVRVFHNVDVDTATAVVDALSEKTLPIVWIVNGKRRVLNPNLSAIEKALVVLHAANSAVSVRELADSIEYENLSRFRNNVLADAHKKKLVELDRKSDSVLLSPVGIAFVEEQIRLEF